MVEIIVDINITGSVHWWLYNRNAHGLRYRYHNSNGHAVEYPDSAKVWYVNGNRHRLDGPAIEWTNGDKEWYVNGIEYDTEFEYWIAVQNYNNLNQ